MLLTYKGIARKASWPLCWNESPSTRTSAGGRPCIRGMRIRVIDVLELLAAGLSAAQILEEMPDLQSEDIQAVLQYAAKKLDHPILAA